MMWAGKPITALSDTELWAAIQTVASMDNFRFDKLQDPRINKPRHRLNKIFNSSPPVENETFTNLAIALNQEFTNRNKDN